MRQKAKAYALSIILLLASFGSVSCGKDSLEKSIGTFTRAVKSARQITTTQHTFGHISDADYASRLRLFLKVYAATDKLGDELVKFGEINDTNRIEVLRLVRDVNAAVVDLINTGSLGVKNDKSKAEFTRWLLVASATVSAIEIAVAAAKKPVSTSNIKIEAIQ